MSKEFGPCHAETLKFQRFTVTLSSEKEPGFINVYFLEFRVKVDHRHRKLTVLLSL